MKRSNLYLFIVVHDAEYNDWHANKLVSTPCECGARPAFQWINEPDSPIKGDIMNCLGCLTEFYDFVEVVTC